MYSNIEHLMSRQSNIVPTNDATAIIIGVGSIGSNIVYMLTSLGVAIEFVDYDIVEEENIFPSFYGMNDIGLLKVDALEMRLSRMFGEPNSISPRAISSTIENYQPSSQYTFAILATDNLETRRIAWNKLNADWFIDARVGGWLCSVFTIASSDKEAMEYHYKYRLEQDDVPLPCGMKATSPLTKGMIPGFVGQSVVSVLNDRPPPYFQQHDLRLAITVTADDIPESARNA